LVAVSSCRLVLSVKISFFCLPFINIYSFMYVQLNVCLRTCVNVIRLQFSWPTTLVFYFKVKLLPVLRAVKHESSEIHLSCFHLGALKGVLFSLPFLPIHTIGEGRWIFVTIDAIQVRQGTSL
jgi:hypothetical protein